MATQTTHYSFNKPAVNGDEDAWGAFLNGNWDTVSTLLGGVDNAEFQILNGATVTTTELNYVSGVTSAIQTQLNAKQAVVANVSDTEIGYLNVASLGTSEASKVVTSDANNVVTFSGGIVEDSVTVTSSSNAATLNMRDGTNFVHDLTENVTYTFSNPASTGNVSAFTLKVIQNASAKTITWPSSVDWPAATAPTLTATNDGVDLFTFITHDGGTTWYGLVVGQALA